MAQVLPCLAQSDEHLEYVYNAVWAKDMWNMILKIFDHHTVLSRLTTRQTLHTGALQSREKVVSYVDRMKWLAGTLMIMSAVIENEKKLCPYWTDLHQILKGSMYHIEPFKIWSFCRSSNISNIWFSSETRWLVHLWFCEKKTALA